MKGFRLLFVLTVCSCLFSCEEDTFEYYDLATPVLMTADELRKSVEIVPPKEILESGKIYVYEDYVFVNDKNKGVHIIDNSNPANPEKISYIKIPGNIDISIKNEVLYANSFIDLVVFDISDIHNIGIINRLTNVFPQQNAIRIPEHVDVVDWQMMNSPNVFVVDWVITEERRLINDDNNNYFPPEFMVMEANMDGANIGAGGSMARFKIVENYLYVVDNHSINIFNISNLEQPDKLEPIFAGFDIETIFNQGNYLFLGSMSGMYIYDITNSGLPTFVSEFQHGTACDPVVVDEEYAYITLRAGNNCGAFESSLQIVNILDIENPVLEASYTMNNPYGLGVKDQLLFICDGNSGLKVYNKSDIHNLILIAHFEQIQSFDVIPLESHLLLIGENVLYQFRYENENIIFLSEFHLN